MTVRQIKQVILLTFLTTFLLNCNKNEKWNYNFSGKDLCNDENGMPVKFITQEDEIKYGIRKIYDLKINEKNDSIFNSFKIIDDCCQKPKDSIRIFKDKIVLIPIFEYTPKCDCYCDYLFEYKFSKKDIKNRKIIVEIK
ncbi:hypothetical protein PG623_10475 [Riemerella anatipestifer]|nr:hypothetical protein [Riemerella anatipestifer]